MNTPDFENLLDGRLLNTVELLGALDKNPSSGSLELDEEWFQNPPAQIAQMFHGNKREALQKFITDLLGSSASWALGGSAGSENETWHAIPDPSGVPTGLYIVLCHKGTGDELSEKSLVIGLGGRYQAMLPDEDSTVSVKCSGSIPLARVLPSGEWEMVLGSVVDPEPASFSVRMGAVSGDYLVDTPLAQLGGLCVCVTIDETIKVDVILEQLLLPGENTPSDRNLADLAADLNDSFGLDFIIKMLLDHLPSSVSEPLQKLLGLDTDGFPRLDLNSLFSGNGQALRQWFDALRVSDKLGAWLAELGKLLGITGSVTGAGTRQDPFCLALGTAGASLTLGVEGQASFMVYPGFKMDLPTFTAGDFALSWLLQTEIAEVDVQTGDVRLLPTMRLAATVTRGNYLIPANTSLSLPSPSGGADLSVSVQVGSLSAGLMYEHGLSLKGFVELYDVQIEDRHWPVMDLNSMEQGLDVALDAARKAIVDELHSFIGLGESASPAATRIGALLGLNEPLSAPEWSIEFITHSNHIGLFLTDPLLSISLYHSRAISGTGYQYIMQDLLHLLRGEDETLEGDGSESTPWRVPLLDVPAPVTPPVIPDTIDLLIVKSTDPKPALSLSIQAKLSKEVSNSVCMNAEINAALLDLTLPTDATDPQGTGAVWFGSAGLQLGFSGMPTLELSGLSITVDELAGEVVWSKADGFDYNLFLKKLAVDYDGDDSTPFTWNRLELPKLGFGGGSDSWSFGDDVEDFGHLLLGMFGQWLIRTSPQGFGLAGLLGLLPDLDDLNLPGLPSWSSSPWQLPDDWPVFSFESGNWGALFADPWQAVKTHLVKLFADPKFALPALRWLGGLFCDCLPDLTLPTLPGGSLDWGKDDGDGGRRFPKLSELPFVITGGGTYENPFRLTVRDATSKWHNGALLVWLDPDGLPVLDIQTMAKICAPRLGADLTGSTSEILARLDFSELLEVIALLQTADADIAAHLKGYGTEITGMLGDLQNWLVNSDGFGQLTRPLAASAEGRLRNTADIATLPLVSHDKQLSVLASELKTFVQSHAEDIANPHLVLVGDEYTDVQEWQELVSALGLSAEQHNFCQYGVAPDLQEIRCNTMSQATIVTLTSVNTDPAKCIDGQFERLALDRLGPNTPAAQLQRVVAQVADGSNRKMIIIGHGTAGFAIRAVLQEMDNGADTTLHSAAKIAGVCTVGMPEIDGSLLPGVLSGSCQQGLDFLLGLIQEGGSAVHDSLMESLSSLGMICGAENRFGYGDVLEPHYVPELGAALVAEVNLLPDSFAGVPCQGLYTRIGVQAGAAPADFSFETLLMGWLEEKLSLLLTATTPESDSHTSPAPPTHVGFGLSWQEERRLTDSDAGDLLVTSETRADLFRIALGGDPDTDDLQALPRLRTEVEVRRDGGWLLGSRRHPIRCRWAEFGLDWYAGTCTPDLVFHDAAIDASGVEKIGIELVQEQLWSAENRVRILLDQFCLQLPVVHKPLSCVFVATGLFYEADGRLLPHADSWQALLTEPTVFMQSAIRAALTDPTRKTALICALEELLGLKKLPVVKDLLSFISQCPDEPEAEIFILALQALGLMKLEGETCWPVWGNWLQLLENPKKYIWRAWADFMANTPEAQARRVVVVTEIGARFNEIDGNTPAPAWLRDMRFDGNKLTFILGGAGFTLAGETGSGSVELSIPVEIDFVNGHVFIRYDVDISGMLGVSTPLADGLVFGGASLFFEIGLTPPGYDEPTMRCGISFDGEVELLLTDAAQWEKVFGRLLTQGLGSWLMREIDDLVENENVKGLIRCLAGGDKTGEMPSRGLSLPGSLTDWQKIITPARVGCILDSVGAVLEVAHEVNGQILWQFDGLQLLYPHSGLDYTFKLATDGALSLYQQDQGQDSVTVSFFVELGIPDSGGVTLHGEVDFDTHFAGAHVGLLAGYNVQTGVFCSLSNADLTLDLIPFSGLGALLDSIGQALLDDVLPALLEYLRHNAGAGSLERKLFRLFKLVLQDFTALRTDFITWLTDTMTALGQVIPAGERESGEIASLTYFDSIISSDCLTLAGGAVTYCIPQTGTSCLNAPIMLELKIGAGVKRGAASSAFGVLVTFTPPAFAQKNPDTQMSTDIVDLSVIAGCWVSGEGVFGGGGEIKLQLAENLLVWSGQSLRPELVFDFDTSSGTSLYLASSADEKPLLKLTILSPLGLELNLAGAGSQIIIPLLEEVLNKVEVKSWLQRPIIDSKTAGDIFASLDLIAAEGAGTSLKYKIKADFGEDWQNPTQALSNILQALLRFADGVTLVSFDDGGSLSLVSRDNWYGLKIKHSGITIADDPEIKLVLGDSTSWVNDCGVAGSSSGYSVGDPGLTLFFLHDDNGIFSPACRFLLADVGLDFRGKGNSKLFDLGVTSAQGIKLRTYVDLTLYPAISAKWAVKAEFLQLGIPLGSGAGGDNPVANSLLSSPEGDTEPVSPAIDCSLAYGKKLSAAIGDSKADDGVAWMQINKQLGPIFIKSLGIKLDDYDLSILVDGKVELAGLQVEVDDLSVTFPLNDMFNFDEWQVDCKGIGIRYKQGDLLIAGALLKYDNPVTGLEYRGVCIIETSGVSFTALGSYTQLGDDPSLFVFMVLNMTIGGPPMVFVRGLAGGLGYNRGLSLPQVEKVDDFILLDAMQGDDALDDPLALMNREDMSTSFPALRGSYWLGLGVKFTTFEIFKSVGLLYLLLDRGFEMGLIGCTTLKMPEDSPLVHLVMNFKARYSSKEGSFEALAQLTNDSWLFDESCRLQGGFALKSWFAGKHKGDFVITLGGYHSKYNKPSHYPDVPRVGFHWQVNSKTSIKGTSYFALTSNAVMAGGELDAAYKSGNLKAWFRVWAHLLVQWKPFLYDVEIGMSIGASYRMSIKIPFVGRISKTFKIELGGNLHIWGPEFSGTATLNWCIISFTVAFGAKTSLPEDKALTWSEFEREFLPSEDGQRKYWNIHAPQGLLEESDNTWLMKAECTIRTESVFPGTMLILGAAHDAAGNFKYEMESDLDIKPMHESEISSTHRVYMSHENTGSIFNSGFVKLGKGLYQIGDDKSIARLQVTFDKQEIAKALWQYDEEADPLDGGAAITGMLGVSLRFYIDNQEALKKVDAISLDLNDRSNCVLPLPFNHDLRAVLPGGIASDWFIALDLTLPADQEKLVAAFYSSSWFDLRKQAVMAMKDAGAILPPVEELVQSRTHQLAGRKGMPTVASLYLGVDNEEASSGWNAPGYTTPEDPFGLGWRLAILTLPVREVRRTRDSHTTIDDIKGIEEVRRINLDSILKGRDAGLVLRSGRSRFGGKQQAARSGRVIVPRSRAAGTTQKLLQEQFYKGLGKESDGSVLNPGMVHVWQSADDIGAGCGLSVRGSQAVRVCCFSRSGAVLMDFETIGTLEKALPAAARRIVITGLGSGSGLEVKGGRNAVSLAESAGAMFPCGWSSSDILPRVSASVIMTRGAILQSREHNGLKRVVGLVNVAEFLKKRTRCATSFSTKIQCVGVMLSRDKAGVSLDDDVEVSFDDGVTIVEQRMVPCGNGILCLYEVKHKDDRKRFRVTVRGQNGWLLNGVYGGVRDLAFWAGVFTASPKQPSVSQDIIANGGTSLVSIAQEGLHEKLQTHRQLLREKGVRRDAITRIWKGEKTW